MMDWHPPVVYYENQVCLGVNMAGKLMYPVHWCHPIPIKSDGPCKCMHPSLAEEWVRFKAETKMRKELNKL